MVVSKNLFTGREKEIALLEGLLDKKTASLVVIKGRRRIGKSRLVREFVQTSCSKARFVSFSGLPPDEGVTPEDQRTHFAQQFSTQLGGAEPDSSSWYNLLLALANWVTTNSKSRTQQPIVILLDEISWMAQDDPTFLPKLKDFWDSHFSQTPRLILFVCGSISSWIEKNILSSTGFLGRINKTLTLDELSLSDSLLLLEKAGFVGSLLEKFLMLSISGGVPWYIELLAQGKSANQSVMETCFSPDGILVTEFEKIFHDLFGRRSDIYAAIVKSLASGSKSHRMIAEVIGYPSGGPLSDYLDDLVLSGFLAFDRTWTGTVQTAAPKKETGTYRLRDNYLRFYFKYIEPQLSRIREGLLENTALSSLRGFNTLMGLQFENLILKNKGLIFEALGLKTEDILFAGRHVQKTTSISAGCEVDLLIHTRFSVLYVCEVKIIMGASPLGIAVEKEVREKIEALSIPKNLAVVPVLIYFGEITSGLEDSEYFAWEINVENLIKNK